MGTGGPAVDMEVIPSRGAGPPNPTRMYHVSFHADPTTALCGAKVRGVFHPGAPVECHVCADIDRELRRQGR